MLTIPLILLAGILVLAGALLLSPGKPAPILGADGSPLPGSISEKVFVDVNGVRQGMFIKARDASNPVLLFIHGGMPEYFLTPHYPSGIEDLFTVVWWEQRGSGISFSADIPPETMTLEQLVSDTLAVTDYLRARFGQDRIYLMGHSGGTFIGIQAAARAPERYHAYIGMAQMSYQLRSEVLAYEYMLEAFRAGGDEKMVLRLEAAPVTMEGGIPDAYQALRDGAMHSLGIGTTRAMRSVVSGIFLPSLLNREYTLVEKLNMWRGKLRAGISVVWDEMTATDLSEKVPALELPVYFVHGIHDYTCSYALARTYFESLDAPLKGFYTFTESAHSPLFEEPQKMLRILRENVLAGRVGLADSP
jgi:pimeloyl-ACP methyl ester carboxylesterase